MAETGMREIKRRIKSVKSTRQITRGMGLVATAKLRRARNRYDATRPYFEKIISTIQDIAKHSGKVKHPYLLQKDVKNELYIIITSDRGLCGGYNINLIKEILSHFEKGREYTFMVVGGKGRDYLKRRGYKVEKEFLQVSEKPGFSDAAEISRAALEMFNEGKGDRVNLAYTRFISTISQKPRIMTLLPVPVEQKENEEDMRDLMTYEPSPEEVIELVIPKYVQSAVYGALVEAAASEQAARRVAMDAATDNANEMINDLVLSYNRARQEIITREISEIVGGAEALK